MVQLSFGAGFRVSLPQNENVASLTQQRPSVWIGAGGSLLPSLEFLGDHGRKAGRDLFNLRSLRVSWD